MIPDPAAKNLTRSGMAGPRPLSVASIGAGRRNHRVPSQVFTIAGYLPGVGIGYFLFITITMYLVLFAFFGGLIAGAVRR